MSVVLGRQCPYKIIFKFFLKAVWVNPWFTWKCYVLLQLFKHHAILKGKIPVCISECVQCIFTGTLYWRDICNHTCLGVSCEWIAQDVCKFGLSVRCMLTLLVQTPNTFLQLKIENYTFYTRKSAPGNILFHFAGLLALYLNLHTFF